MSNGNGKDHQKARSPHTARHARAPIYRPSEFRWRNDPDRCAKCKRCVTQCGFKAISWQDNRPVADSSKCVGCHRCEARKRRS